MTSQTSPHAPTAGAATSRGGVRSLLVDRSVRTKFLLSIAFVSLVAIAVGITAAVSGAALRGSAQDLYQLQRTIVADRGTVHQDEIKARLLIAQIAAVSSIQDKETYAKKLKDNDVELDAAVARVDAAGGSRIMPTWDTFKSDFDAWRQLRDTELLPPAMAGDHARYSALLDSKSQPMIDTFVDDLDQASAALTAHSAALAKQAEDAAAAGSRAVLIALVLGLAIGLALAVWVANALVRRVRDLKVAIDAMADGDLTARATVDSADDLGQMAAALNAAQESVRVVVEQV
ncbi:HAMP domain-containing protein, partial [Angustibacter luteus]